MKPNNLLGIRKFLNYTLFLIVLEGNFVEVWFCPMNRDIVRMEIQNDPAVLELYTSGVDFSEIHELLNEKHNK